MNKKGKIIELQIIHKVPIENLGLPKRWIVWATTKETEEVKYYVPTDRVWLCTVTDDSDVLPLRQRSLLVKNFFEPLIGKNIEFSEKSSEDWFDSCYGAHKNTLPKPYQQVDSYSGIYSWFQKNRPECMENDLKILREKKNREVAAAKKKEQGNQRKGIRRTTKKCS